MGLLGDLVKRLGPVPGAGVPMPCDCEDPWRSTGPAPAPDELTGHRPGDAPDLLRDDATALRGATSRPAERREKAEPGS